MTRPLDQVSYRRGYVTADFLTHDYRISGEVDVRARPLTDLLNDPRTDFVQVENIYASPIQRPADIRASYRLGALCKANTSLVILAREQDGISRRAAYGQYHGRSQYRVFLTVPGFEVHGHLEAGAHMDIRTYLVSVADRFISVMDATAAVSSNPEICFQGGLILANKDLIGVLCMSEETEN